MSISRVATALLAFDEEVARRRRAFDGSAADPKDLDWVKRKLAHMADVDQFLRRQVDDAQVRGYAKEEFDLFWEEFNKRWEAIDSLNTEGLKGLLKHHDWFKISEFGAEADQAAWLLAQHADRDLGFQRQVLSILERLLPSGETSGSNYAYLYDRVAIAEHRPQRFGTQGRCVGPGRWEPWPSEDPRNLQARRDTMGLGPLEENIRRVSLQCHGMTG